MILGMFLSKDIVKGPFFEYHSMQYHFSIPSSCWVLRCTLILLRNKQAGLFCISFPGRDALRTEVVSSTFLNWCLILRMKCHFASTSEMYDLFELSALTVAWKRRICDWRRSKKILKWSAFCCNGCEATHEVFLLCLLMEVHLFGMPHKDIKELQIWFPKERPLYLFGPKKVNNSSDACNGSCFANPLIETHYSKNCCCIVSIMVQ